MAIKSFQKIVVTLVRPGKETPYLQVDVPREVTDVHQSKSGQPLYWELQLDGAQGSFNTQGDDISPGFAWIGSHPFPGIFSAPALFDGGKILGINDLHNRSDKIGTWYYRLSATIDGVVYRTKFHEPYPRRVSLPRQPNPSRDAVPAAIAAERGPRRPVAVMRHVVSQPTTAGTAFGTPTAQTASNPTIKNR